MVNLFPRMRGSEPSSYALFGLLTLQLVACSTKATAARSVPPAPTVEVTRVVEAQSAAMLSLTGTIQPESTTSLSFPVPGTIVSVDVQEGDAVARGALIARIAAGSYRDTYAIAKSKQAQAEDAYQRLRPMYENATLPEVKMVEVEKGREQAKLAASLAAKNLGDTTLRAPSSGVVIRRLAEPGSTAAPGVPIVTLVSMDSVLAVVPVPEIRVMQVDRGVPVPVRVPALSQTFEGSVQEIGVVADPLTRTYPVKIEVANPDRKLRLGMLATVELPLLDQSQALVVPPTALRTDANGKPYLYVLEKGDTLSRRSVVVGGYFRDGVSLRAGVRVGQRVVTSGTPMLGDGMAVQVAPTDRK